MKTRKITAALIFVAAAVLFAGCATHSGVFEQMPATQGWLTLSCEIPQSDVYLDGKLMGKAQEFQGVANCLRTTTGKHTLEVRADGYEPFISEITACDQGQNVQVTLKKKAQ